MRLVFMSVLISTTFSKEPFSAVDQRLKQRRFTKMFRIFFSTASHEGRGDIVGLCAWSFQVQVLTIFINNRVVIYTIETQFIYLLFSSSLPWKIANPIVEDIPSLNSKERSEKFQAVCFLLRTWGECFWSAFGGKDVPWQPNYNVTKSVWL